MTRLSVLLAIVGVIVGIAVLALAHSGDGFESGPLVFLTLVVSILGLLMASTLFLVGKRGGNVKGIAFFSAGVLLVLVIGPLIWPYPRSDPPRPISGDSPTKDGR
jgi:cytochrome bd-type quinol oxidase subunit 2